MVRTPCCSKVGLHKGPWTSIEDTLLTRYIETHGEGNWKNLPAKAGLLRCGKSCRMRWVNYLRPDIKRGNIGPEEEDLIIRLHALLGNRWSLIARRLPGRTDNEIKNFWNIHLSKKLKMQGVEVKEGSSRCTSKQSDISSTTNNKNSKNKMKVSTKIKIHTPKPTRLVSILRNPNYMTEKSGQGVANGSTIYEGDLDHFLDQCDIPPQGDMLERLLEEYSHILNSGIDQFELEHSSEFVML